MQIPFSFFLGIAIVLVLVLCLTYFIKDGTRFNSTLIFVAGFVIGMLTLYIKVRLLSR